MTLLAAPAATSSGTTPAPPRSFTPLLTIHAHTPSRGHSSAPSQANRRRAPQALTATELGAESPATPYQLPEQRLWIRVFHSLREDLERRGKDAYVCRLTSADRAILDFISSACGLPGGVGDVLALAERARVAKLAARRQKVVEA